MQYVMLIASDESAWESMPEDERAAIYAKIGAWFEEHGGAGRVVGGHELQPVSTATTIRLTGREPTVTDGPFIESREVIGGYCVLDCADLDEAIRIAKSWPSPNAVLELRPVVDHGASS